MGEYWFRSQWSEYPLPPLHRCCRDGDVESLVSLLDGDRLEVFHSVCQQDRFLTWTPAHWSSYFGKLECLRRLVACGLNIDIIDGRFHQTPAHVAAFAGHPRLLLWIIQSGANINRMDTLGETVVHKAARGGHVECLTLLQAHGSQMDVPNLKGETPCELAMSLSYEECARYLKQFTPSAWLQRPSKRSLDEDNEEYGSGFKKARNGFVHYSNYVEVHEHNPEPTSQGFPSMENMDHVQNGFTNGYDTNGLNCGDILNNNNIINDSHQNGRVESDVQTMETVDTAMDDTPTPRTPRCVAICPQYFDHRGGYFY